MSGLVGNNTPPHLDRSWESGILRPCVEGIVTGVFYPGDPNNPLSDSETSGVIAYQVTVETRRPYGQGVLFPVPAADQFTGIEGYDQVDPIPVGTGVLVEFMEGDQERPLICRVLWGYNSKLLKSLADQPHSEWDRRGAKHRVDKYGNVEIEISETRSLKIKDSAGNVLLQIIDPGSGYEIHLGGDGSLQKLMTEAMMSIFNAHTHPETGTTTGMPIQTLNSSHTTAITRAK